MADIAASVACEVAKCLVAPVGRHCGYVIFSDRRVCELNVEVKKLGDKKAEVQRSIDDAQNNMKPIKAMVETWVKEVETVANKAHDVLDYEGRAQKTCFYGWFPNPKARYRLGNEASKMIKEIKDLIVQGQFERVYDEISPPGRVGSASDVNSSTGDGGNTMLKSQASTFQDLMKALDDEKYKVIGVYGPGGVGKTILLEIVKEKLNKEGKEGRPFHMIVKSKVSQTSDLTKIQYDIAYALGLKDLKDEPSEEGRRDLLSERLQMDPSEKVLIILDDLWAELDLEAIGIPLGDESMGCKLLLTSRDKSVLEQMHADQTFPLKSLEEEEALKLFEKIVGDRLRDNEELKEKAAQVVTKLAGLPLLINSVASTLKCSDVSTWKDMLIKIEHPHNERIVKWSYDHLESEEAKCLFLLCGLIGGTIRVELLLELGMGLGLFGGFDNKMQSSRNRLNAMLNSLHSFCLLQDGGDGKENVTIHDLYSEAVVSDAFSGQNSLMINNDYGSWPKEKLEKCWACLVNVGSDRLVELTLRRFPHMKILMLSEQYNVGDCSKMDFTYMEELRALYLCSMRITSLPSSMEILRNLQSLSINCHVEDVANLDKLKALRILSFAGSTISRLPEEIGKLTNLGSLNLNRCYSLQRIKPGVLKCLIKLEELHMKGSFDQWMGKNDNPSELCNVGLAELRSMTKLNSLEISIHDPIVLLEVDDLPFENLTRFWINMGNVDGSEFKGLRTMKIKLEGHDSILSKKWVQKILQKTQYLCLDGLGEFENAHELCIQGFPQLKHLDIQNSPSIKYIASSSNSAFTILESLFLNDLINLEKICHRHITTECFSKLKAVRVKECNQLKYFWCLSQMQNLVQLEKIKVWECGSMRAIARKDRVSTNNGAELPYLRCLDLAKLPNMASFCTEAEITSEGAPIQVGVVDGGGGDEGTESVTITSDLQDTYSDFFFDGKISLPNLEDLELNSVGSFKRIWQNELSRNSFCKLATITVENCFDLLHIFPSTIIGRLYNLQSVKVKNCPSLKSLLDFGSLDSDTEQTTVLLSELASINVESCPSLESLFNYKSLDSNAEHKFVLLPKLEAVWVSGAKKLRHVVMSHSQIVLGFPSLEIVSVENCSDLRYLFPNYTAKTLVKLERLEISKCEQIEEVILEKEVGRSKAEVMSFPCLSELSLKKLDSLISFGSGSSYNFSSLEDLRIVGCYNFGAFIPSPTSVKRQLGETAEENDELPQSLFNEMVTFPNIRNLEIEDVPCKELWNNHVPANSIVHSRQFLLKNVKVKNCPSLKSLFDFGSLDSNTEQNAVLLPELVTIDVESCPSLESLFNYKSLDSNVEHKFVLLPKLEAVWVSGAKKLRHVVMSHSQIVLGFPSLEIVSVENCSDLRYLFPNYTAKTLVKLERLEISKCEQIEEVILEKEVGRSKAEVMSFPCLSELKLKKLDSLISFGSGSSYNFSSLEDLRIVGCCNFGAFIPSPTSVKRQLGKTAEENDELPQSLFNEMVTFPNIRNLEIEDVPCKELWNNHVPADSIVRSHQFLLENVKVKNCPSLKSLFNFGSLDSNTKQNAILLPKLVRIDVESCPSLESLFNCGSLNSNAEHKIILLPKLKVVKVSEAKKLRHMVMSHSQIVLGFPCLKGVTVKKCSNMRYLFSNYTATTLVKLEWVIISECEWMKEVILEKEAGRSEAEVMSFPCLSELSLTKLNSLISFSSGSCSYYFSSLEYLRIVGCCNFGAFISSPTSVKRQLGETAKENDESPQLLFNEMVTFLNIRNLEIEDVPCKELWNNQIPTDSFQKLEYLKLRKCDNLQRIATSYMWKKLQCCLEKLEVISCRSIEIIYEGNGMDTQSGKLRRLVLRDLENLRCIWQSDSHPNIPFPDLRYVEAVRCSRLEMLFPTFTAKFLGQIKELVVESCEDMKLIAGHEKWEEVTGTTITFSDLTVLKLFKLSKFESFLPEKYSLKFPCSEDFPSLQDLLIVNCKEEPYELRRYLRKREDRELEYRMRS